MSKSGNWIVFFFKEKITLKHLKNCHVIRPESPPLCEKKCGGTVLLSQKKEAWYAEPNERVEAATSSYSAADDFL